MAFLDFIKNREGQRPVAEQQSQQQRPEASKQVTRGGAEVDAPAKAIAQLPSEEKVKARDIGSRVELVGQNISQNAPANTSAPSDNASTPEAMRQGMTGTNKSQPALSPTDGQVANTSLEKDAAPSFDKTPSKEQEATVHSPAHTPHTPQRDRGGWER